MIKLSDQNTKYIVLVEFELQYAYNHGIFIIYVFFLFQDEPFVSNLPEALFNMARFLLHAIIREVPLGISKVYVTIDIDNNIIESRVVVLFCSGSP